MISSEIDTAFSPSTVVETVRLVNDVRLDARPRDLVPQQRDRVAVGARINHRLSNGTIRIEERVYTDNWGIKASTTDGRYLHDLGEHLRVKHGVHHAFTTAERVDLRAQPAPHVRVRLHEPADRDLRVAGLFHPLRHLGDDLGDE